jgi:hypothetical protein
MRITHSNSTPRVKIFNFAVQGRMFVTELETSARTESNRMTNHKTLELSPMDLPIHCAAFPGVPRLNTWAITITKISLENHTELLL